MLQVTTKTYFQNTSLFIFQFHFSEGDVPTKMMHGLIVPVTKLGELVKLQVYSLLALTNYHN